MFQSKTGVYFGFHALRNSALWTCCGYVDNVSMCYFLKFEFNKIGSQFIQTKTFPVCVFFYSDFIYTLSQIAFGEYPRTQ